MRGGGWKGMLPGCAVGGGVGQCGDSGAGEGCGGMECRQQASGAGGLRAV